jgi:uncharacterized protein YecT (DUF1311 family)
MHCTQCGSENSIESSFCQKCGAPLASVSNKSNPKAGANHSDSVGAIWNPNATGTWSYVFTPAFGSYMQMLNWQTLGQPEKAASAKTWFYISLLMLVGNIVIRAFMPDQKAAAGIASAVLIIYLFVWYFGAGRAQAKYVKEKLGNTYPRKGWTKPLCIAVAAMVANVAVVMAAAIFGGGSIDAVLGSDGPSTVVASKGPSTSFASSKSNGAPSCAAADVKRMITDSYAKPLIATGLPDLVTAITNDRIKFRVERIAETQRNSESENVRCSGQLVIEFPAEDFARAAKLMEIGGTQPTMRREDMAFDPVFSLMLAYSVSNPVDKEEKENGPIVKLIERKGTVESDMRLYVLIYTTLNDDASDITSSSTNHKKWDKEWKNASIDECGQSLNPELCKCKVNQLEMVLAQDHIQRIAYTMENRAGFAEKKFPNFIELSENLNKQCPLPTQANNVATAAGMKSQPVVAVASPAAVSSQPAHQNKPEPKVLTAQVKPEIPVPSTAPSETKLPIIAASFDCAKASVRIEKLICSTPETASADKRLSLAYSAARSKTADDQKLKTDQLQWMKQQRNACDDSACLLKVTADRIQTLSQL